MKLHVLGANRTKISLPSSGVEVFFSYNTPVAAYVPSVGFLQTDMNCSRTTSRHLGEFLPNRASTPQRPQAFFDALLTMSESHL